MAADIIDPFHRKLYNEVMLVVSERVAQLAGGAAASNPSITVAESYAAQVSYIKALNDVLNKCHEIEVEQYGARPASEEAA